FRIDLLQAPDLLILQREARRWRMRAISCIDGGDALTPLNHLHLRKLRNGHFQEPCLHARNDVGIILAELLELRLRNVADGKMDVFGADRHHVQRADVDNFPSTYLEAAQALIESAPRTPAEDRAVIANRADQSD